MANAVYKVEKSVEYGENRYTVSVSSDGYLGLGSDWKYIGMADSEENAIAVMETYKHRPVTELVTMRSNTTYRKFYE